MYFSHIMCTEYYFFHVESAEPPCLSIRQIGPTSIQAEWTPSIYLTDDDGFQLSYTGGSSGSVHIENHNTNSHIFTGLKNEANYTMTIYTTNEYNIPSRETVSNLLHMGKQWKMVIKLIRM